MLKKFLSITVISLIAIAAGLLFTPAYSANTSSFGANVFNNVVDFLQDLVPERSATKQADNNQVPTYKPVIDYEQAVTSAVENSLPSVVSIAVTKNIQTIERCRENFRGLEILKPCPGEEQNVEVGGGSGFIVSEDGLVVTNKHVVQDEKADYTVVTNDGAQHEAEIIDVDPVQDIAILKIDDQDLKPIKLGNSESIKLGQTAIAIGNSLGEFRNTVSVGVVSGLARDITAAGLGFVERIEGVIQTDAAINQGNSGGPLLNLKGEVIGMNTAVAQDAQNVGFAIPINRVKTDIKSVQETGEIKTPFLGVRYVPVDKRIQEEQDLPVDYGALVRGTINGPAVAVDSAAKEAGIQAEDIIIEINGIKINEDNSLGSIIQRQSIGDKISIIVLRDGEEVNLEATLGERPDLEN